MLIINKKAKQKFCSFVFGYKKHNSNALQRQNYSYFLFIDDILKEIYPIEDKCCKISDSEDLNSSKHKPQKYSNTSSCLKALYQYFQKYY
ncbi:hypothetical protein CGC58_12410 [Capnocytophaga stomatis]|uniref:Uncharacterized protein n=1 Tax=Capnocytophaga stomatis TaxID=1848904 RepID=A0A250G2K2_9FLAO|nr:hypothetical protein CGC58_12410 [Capnocytophaga stomatis]